MPRFETHNTKITAIAACVPKNEKRNSDYTWVDEEERAALIKNTGVVSKRVAPDHITSSDLCTAAAEKILSASNTYAEEIDMIIYVSQSPDYFIPATSHIIHEKLSLKKSCITFDVNLGCSGYVYGLSIISQFIQNGVVKKALLLAGDKSSFTVSPRDKSTYPLFGDAGSATLLEYDEKAAPIFFHLNADGTGHKAIHLPVGGCRIPFTVDALEYKEIEKGIVRNGISVNMDGIAVFNFTIREVPKLVKEVLEQADRSIDDTDYIVFHQANKFINDFLRKKIKIPEEKFPYSIDKYGNTSSASIPLTICSELKEKLKNNSRLLLAGFGVGLSWGGAYIDSESILVLDVLELE